MPAIKTKTSWVATVLLLFMGCTHGDGEGQQAEAVTASPVPQHVDPIFNQTSRDPTEIYDPPSATTRLTVGHRLDFPSDFNLLLTPYVVQRLTDRTYWIGISVYQSLAYVGDRGVLLIDCAGPLGVDFGRSLVDAVASITPLPITSVVYSHAHTDHVGACTFLKQRNPNLEIIANEATADEISRYGYPLATPTRIVKGRFTSFSFEGRKFRMVAPVPVAHTTGDTYIITPDRVLHAVDIVHPGRLPFVNGMNNQNLDGYVTFLRYLAGERDNYDFASWGHLNVGYAKDVDMTLDYFRKLYEAWWPTFLANTPDHFVDPTQDNAAVWFRNFYDAMAENLFYAVAPQFGNVPMIELGRDHALRVQIFMYTYRWNPFTGQPPNLPSFAPIPPRYE